jgi:HEAT repeat protein
MAAADALGRSGDRAVAADLLVAIEHPHEGVRAGAARALGRLGSEAAVPRLREMLVGGSAVEVVAAAEALGRIGSPAAIEALLVPLGDLSLTPRRHAAMDALEALGEPAVDPLVGLLDAGAAHVRYNATEALGYVASPAASEALADTLLRDGDEAVRAEAARALGQIGGPVARSALGRAAERDASPLVQGAAEAAMDRAGRNSAGTAPWLVRLAETLDGLQPVRWLLLSLSLAGAAWLLLGQENAPLATVIRRVED